ncbi:MAG: sigma-70 family RNA polymerase sigma factor [Rhodothalassiaceae bacterium]
MAAPDDVAQDPIAHLSDTDFKRALGEIIPHLRAFARSLCGNADTADDLVQETMLKAWQARKRFAAGTSMRAWTFVILRNLFVSQMRRNRFHANWDDRVAERTLSCQPEGGGNLALADLQRALLTLPTEQREALILVGAGGLGYADVADICGCAVGTVKSRVARARAALEKRFERDAVPSRSGEMGQVDGRSAFDALMGEADRLAQR